MAAQCRFRISPSISELFEQACLSCHCSSFRIAGKISNFWIDLLSLKEVRWEFYYGKICEGEKWKLGGNYVVGGRVSEKEACNS